MHACNTACARSDRLHHATRCHVALRCAGMEFEKRILANEKNNMKFNFLVPTDPYHAYYRMRVSGRRWMTTRARAGTARHGAGRTPMRPGCMPGRPQTPQKPQRDLAAASRTC